MKASLWLHHLEHCNCSRRDVLGIAGAATTVAMLGTGTAQAASADRRGGGHHHGPRFDDTVFDYADPANLGDWTPSRYGRGDQRGSFNEVNEDKTGKVLRDVVDRGRSVKTYNLGELMFNGFPAFVTTPARGYQQRATVTGYTPPADFAPGGGYITSVNPIGTNRISIHEERFPNIGPDAPAGSTFQIGTQLDNLNHIGAGEFFYNGFKGPEILKSFGTTKIGAEHMGPIVTRGVLLDVLGAKLARRQSNALGAPALNGKPVLLDNYRITVEDIQEAMEFGKIKSLEPGDVVLFRTGWNQLLRSRSPTEFTRWGAQVGLPGIWLKEARWLAQFRPAVIGSDTWALELLGRPDVTGQTAFCVHQELIMRGGIRIGESIVTDELAADKVYEFAYVTTPQFSEGATAGNAPPIAMARPRGR